MTIRRTRPRTLGSCVRAAAITVIVLAAGSSAAACGSVPALSAAMRAKLAKVQAQIAFKIALPAYLPAGWHLTYVRLRRPAPLLHQYVVVLGFASDGKGGLKLSESNYETTMSGPETPVALSGGVRGQLRSGQTIGAARTPYMMLVFKLHHVGYSMLAEHLARHTLLRIASSLVPSR